MQAAWGQEKSAPQPSRGGELYGEVGRWKISQMESIPGIYTGAEDPGKKWGSPAKKKVPVQKQSTKRPPEMDIAPAGVKSTIGSRPAVMCMADHDKGLQWPPTKPSDATQIPFMAMVPEKKVDYHNEVNGIMIGYQGHVPRARDKVGSCPLGSVPGRPAAPNRAVNDPKGLKQTTKSVKGSTSPRANSPRPALLLPSRPLRPWRPTPPVDGGPNARRLRCRPTSTAPITCHMTAATLAPLSRFRALALLPPQATSRLSTSRRHMTRRAKRCSPSLATLMVRSA